MKKISVLQLFFTLFTDQKSLVKFAIAVIFGFAFSISVILSTIGIMDGFEKSLKQGLNRSNGDITIGSRNGFFTFDENVKELLTRNHFTKFSQVVQSESFLVSNEDSKGVLVKGIDELYGEVVGLNLALNTNEIILGIEIANQLKLKIGDQVTLAFAKGNQGVKGMPGLFRYTVKDFVNHGVYQKDSRLVYLNINEVQKNLDLDHRINSLVLKIDPSEFKNMDSDTVFKRKMDALKMDLPDDFFVRPFWRDFSSLLEAVKVEKTMIALILQLIVVISIFNVLAFIIFVNEKKSKEIFLFKALGMSQKMIAQLWFKIVIIIWGLSCVISVVFVYIFKLLLKYFSLFNLPSEIYYMPRLEMYLSLKDYTLVFFMAFVWINLITFILLRRIRNKPLLEGLRQEFA